MAEKNDLLERELHILRKEYEKHRMTDFQVGQLQEKIREAKEMDQNNKNHTGSGRALCHTAQHVGDDRARDGTDPDHRTACQGGDIPRLCV